MSLNHYRFDPDFFTRHNRQAQEPQQGRKACQWEPKYEDGSVPLRHEIVDSGALGDPETSRFRQERVIGSNILVGTGSRASSRKLTRAFGRADTEESRGFEREIPPLVPRDTTKFALDTWAFNYTGEPRDFLFTRAIFQVPLYIRATSNGSGKSTLLNLLGDALPAWPISNHMAAEVAKHSAQWANGIAAFIGERSHILLLDEPSSPPDSSPSGLLARAINEYDGCVIVVSYDARRCARLVGGSAAILDLDEPASKNSGGLLRRIVERRERLLCIASRDFLSLLQAISKAVENLRRADQHEIRKSLLGSRTDLPWPERAQWLVNNVNKSP